MKHLRLMSALSVLAFSAIMLTSCEKQITSENQTPTRSNVRSLKASDVNWVRVTVNGVDLDGFGSPAVNPGTPFDVTVNYFCGRVSIARGYKLAEDGMTKIYANLSAEDPALEWENITNFNCNPNGFSITETAATAGTYLYQTKHQPNNPNNAACGKSKCEGMNGIQFRVWSVSVTEPVTE